MIPLVLVVALGLPLNPLVTQSNIHTTICVPGWSTAQRPPTDYTNRIKAGLLDRAHLYRGLTHNYELDHRIPIELGGSPRDPANLWLQPWIGPNGARTKDALENSMHRSVCRGKVTLSYAQSCMAKNWKGCKP